MAYEIPYQLDTQPGPAPGPPPDGRYSVLAYARQLEALLPRGTAWLLEEGSVLSRMLRGIATELARVGSRAVDLTEEMDPSRAAEVLEDWERALALPDSCAGELPDTVEARRALVVARLVTRGGQSRAYFASLAEQLGYPGTTVTEFRPLRAAFRAGDRVQDDRWAHVWQVDLPIEEPGLGEAFRAGSRAGDRVTAFRPLDVHCVMRAAAPAHTVVLFSYTG